MLLKRVNNKETSFDCLFEMSPQREWRSYLENSLYCPALLVFLTLSSLCFKHLTLAEAYGLWFKCKSRAFIKRVISGSSRSSLSVLPVWTGCWDRSTASLHLHNFTPGSESAAGVEVVSQLNCAQYLWRFGWCWWRLGDISPKLNIATWAQPRVTGDRAVLCTLQKVRHVSEARKRAIRNSNLKRSSTADNCL